MGLGRWINFKRIFCSFKMTYMFPILILFTNEYKKIFGIYSNSTLHGKQNTFHCFSCTLVVKKNKWCANNNLCLVFSDIHRQVYKSLSCSHVLQSKGKWVIYGLRAIFLFLANHYWHLKPSLFIFVY